MLKIFVLSGELGRTAEEALSQHSDPASRIFFTEYDDDIDDQVTSLYYILSHP